MKGFESILAVIIFASAVTAQTCPNNNNSIPIPNNCNAYLSCSTGTPVQSACPTGQYYDCMNLQCSTRVYPACCSYDASVNWTAMYPNKLDLLSYSCASGATLKNQMNGACGVYFACVNNVVGNQACNASQDFNNVTGTCEASATCTTPGAVATTTTTTVKPTSPVYYCPPGNTYSNWTNCQNYITNVNGTAVNAECPGGGYFNGFTKCCGNLSYATNLNCMGDPYMPLRNNLSCSNTSRVVENTGYCGRYLQCLRIGNANVTIPRSCAYNQQFDWVKKQCVPAANATLVPGCRTTGYSACVESPRWLLKTRCSLLYKWIINRPNAYNNCISRGCSISISLKMN